MLPATPKASERDLSVRFDGRWVLQLSEQYGNCKYNFGNRTYLNIKDGIGKISGGNGYVTKTGDFRIISAIA